MKMGASMLDICVMDREMGREFSIIGMEDIMTGIGKKT